MLYLRRLHEFEMDTMGRILAFSGPSILFSLGLALQASEALDKVESSGDLAFKQCHRQFGASNHHEWRRDNRTYLPSWGVPPIQLVT